MLTIAGHDNRWQVLIYEEWTDWSIQLYNKKTYESGNLQGFEFDHINYVEVTKPNWFKQLLSRFWK